MRGDKKIKILGFCDSPSCATGFGSVSRNIFEALYRTGRYEIDIFGINYFGDPHTFPYRIWPAGVNNDKDPYGRQKFVTFARQADFDILFLLQDSFILNFLPILLPHLKSKRGDTFKSILYFPVDSVLKEQWAENISGADRLVAYSEFGKREALKVMSDREDMIVIPHGVNTGDFYPLTMQQKESFRREYFKSEADKFIITNLNRNQQRKDIPRTIQAFKEFRKHVPNSVLYLHMAMKDQGWDLPAVCEQMGLSTSRDVIFPKNFGPSQGYPREVVNALYNASDVVVSTAYGEGFGLCVHPQTHVYTEKGIKEIKDISVFDKVLSSNGVYNKVEATMSKEHSGDLYEITTWMSNIPIKTSGQHGFMVKEAGTTCWKKASNLKVSDVLMFPKNNPGNDTKFTINILDTIKPLLNDTQIKNIKIVDDKFRIMSNFTKNSGNMVPLSVNITPELSRLFGIYLAEGCVSASKMDSIIFSFHKKEKKLMKFVEETMLKYFGLKRFNQDISSRGANYNGAVIRFYSSAVANLFYILFGSGARNKKVPLILSNLPDNYLLEFIKGHFLGDGSIEKKQIIFSTTSTDIAYFLRLMLARIGVISSVRTSRVEYKVWVGGSSRRRLCDLFGIDYEEVDISKAVEKAYQDDDFIYMPIKTINITNYSGKLLDIQVKNTNDFVAENVVVHNSWIEAMATKTPVLMPDNTAMTEFITPDKGYLIDSGTNPSLWTVTPRDNEVMRPLVDVDDMVKKLVHIYNNKEEVKQKVDTAYKWVTTEMEWQDAIADKWVRLFDETVETIGKSGDMTATDTDKTINSEVF